MKRYFFLLTLTLFFSFGGGFFMGFADEKILDRLGLGPPTITFLTEDSDLISDNLIQVISKQSGVRLKILKASSFEDFQKFSLEAELVLARICWLEQLKFNAEQIDLRQQPWVDKNISPDFLTFNHRNIKFVPLFWNIGNSLHTNRLENGEALNIKQSMNLMLVGLLAKASEYTSRVTEVLIKKSIIQTWVETIPWATTYMSLDESLIEKYQKAAYLRELPFQNISLVEAGHPDCNINLKDLINH